MQLFETALFFEWDHGNRDKNFMRHGVSDGECEEAFFDHHKKILSDALHSGKESRSVLLGSTRTGRILFLVFTMRGHKIRVISARDLNRKERHLYEEKN